MLKTLKKMFGIKPTEASKEVPYKVEAPLVQLGPEPAKCGCGRSTSGLCVGLHALSESDWAVNDANPNKVIAEEKPTKQARKPRAPKAEKPASPKKPRAPKKPKAE